MKDPENPREAYNRQSKLLRDAFKKDEMIQATFGCAYPAEIDVLCSYGG